LLVIPFGEPDKVEDARCHSNWGTGQTDVIPVGEPDKVVVIPVGEPDKVAVIPVGEPDKLMSCRRTFPENLPFTREEIFPTNLLRRQFINRLAGEEGQTAFLVIK
jgi:hypothetical protein